MFSPSFLISELRLYTLSHETCPRALCPWAPRAARRLPPNPVEKAPFHGHFSVVGNGKNDWPPLFRLYTLSHETRPRALCPWAPPARRGVYRRARRRKPH